MKILKAAFLVLLVLVGAGRTTASEDAAGLEQGFLYPTSFLCGLSSEEFQEGVVRGNYETLIQVFNPSARAAAHLAKTAARALPYQESLPRSRTEAGMLGPGQSMAIECNEIRQLLAAPMTTAWRSGYLLLSSDRRVVVSVVYSAGPDGREISTSDTLDIHSLRLCGPGERSAGGRCSCPKGLMGQFCEVSIAKRSGPTFLRMRWVGIDRPGDIVRSGDDCVSLEVQSFSQRALLAEIEFYGTLNGRPLPMLSPLTSVPLGALETVIVSRCLRDFERDGPDDLLELAFSATLNARATVFDGIDRAGERLDRIFAPTGYFHVDAAPEQFVPYTAVLYDATARRETFAGGDYAGRLGFSLPPGGIFVGDTHPDALYDEGGPAPPPDVLPEP